MGGRLVEYLLDTHIWLWYLTEHSSLGVGLRRTIQRSIDRCWLSPISIWEVGVLVERGRLQPNKSIREWAAEAQTRLPLREAAVTREIAVRAGEIRLGTRDPADRILAATADVRGMSLITVDRRLTSATWLDTRSK